MIFPFAWMVEVHSIVVVAILITAFRSPKKRETRRTRFRFGNCAKQRSDLCGNYSVP